MRTTGTTACSLQDDWRIIPQPDPQSRRALRRADRADRYPAPHRRLRARRAVDGLAHRDAGAALPRRSRSSGRRHRHQLQPHFSAPRLCLRSVQQRPVRSSTAAPACSSTPSPETSGCSRRTSSPSPCAKPTRSPTSSACNTSIRPTPRISPAAFRRFPYIYSPANPRYVSPASLVFVQKGMRWP